MRTCTKCRSETADFHSEKVKWCRQCTREYNREYRARQADEIREYDRQRYHADVETNRRLRRDSYRRFRTSRIARADQWRRANMERVTDANKRYRESHPERWKEYQRRWRKKNNDVKTAEKHRRRARMLGAPGSGVTARQWREVKASYLGLCAYCGAPCRQTMDHIDPVSRGGAHDVENIAPACKRCNYSKQDVPLCLWLAKSRMVAT